MFKQYKWVNDHFTEKILEAIDLSDDMTTLLSR